MTKEKGSGEKRKSGGRRGVRLSKRERERAGHYLLCDRAPQQTGRE